MTATGTWAITQGHAGGVPLLDISFDGREGRIHTQFLTDAAPWSTAVGNATSMVSEAGTLVLRDYKGAVIGTSGIAEFDGAERYRQSVQDLGIAIEPEQQIALALAAVSIADLRELRRAYPDADGLTAVALSHRGVSVGEAVALREAQAAPMSAKAMLTALLSRAR